MRKTVFQKITAALLALVLCLSMANLFVSTARADDYAPGDWEKVNVNGQNVWAWVLSSTAKNCTSFDVSFEVNMHANTKCKTWNVWVRSAGSFTKVGSLYLSEGSGYTYQTIRLSPSKTFDAVAITPTATGGYTYDFSLGIYEIVAQTDKGKDGPKDGYLSGEWEKIRIDSINTYALMLDSTLYRVKELTIDVEVELLNGAYCEDWRVWVIRDGDYSEVKSIYIPRNTGTATVTLSFRNGRTIDGIAITPKKTGGYSWNMGFGVYDVKY